MKPRLLFFILLLSFLSIYFLQKGNESQKKVDPHPTVGSAMQENKSSSSEKKPAPAPKNSQHSQTSKAQAISTTQKVSKQFKTTTETLPKNQKPETEVSKLKNQLLDPDLDILRRHEIEMDLVKSEQENIDAEVQNILETGIIDLDLDESDRAAGAIDRIKSGLRIAGARNYLPAIPSIVTIATHPESELDLQLEAIKALGHLDSETSKEFLATFEADDEYLQGQVLLSRAMLKDDKSFRDSIETLSTTDPDLQQSALNAIMLTVNSSNEDELFQQIDHIQPENHLALGMTLKTHGSQGAILKLQELQQKYGKPFSDILEGLKN